MNINFRKGKPRDAEICASICYEAFKAIADQHHFPPDFPDRESAFGLIPQLLSREDIYSVIAESDGRVVGSNFLWENGVIAGVGPITVEPGVQNSAIGRQLMENVLRRAHQRRFAGVRLLQSAYHNRSLSLSLSLYKTGFRRARAAVESPRSTDRHANSRLHRAPSQGERPRGLQLTLSQGAWS